MGLNEAATRALLIDPQLRAADWPLNDRFYVTEISKHQPFAPFGFMANGHETWFWEVGLSNPRLVAGFFTPDDLRRLHFLRVEQQPLASTSINSSIVDRAYQHEAIRRVAEAFAANRRRALLVMATGTGKTRTTMALIDVFLRANQARHVLFLADRDALVDQALTDGFKRHLPNEPRDRIYTYQVDKAKRLFVATEQTLALCYSKFSPGFFDLIIFDEAHRSIFKRFTEVIEYFDARMIGLTATPAKFIDRDTFRLFGCDASTPTFLYDYAQAVKEKYLVEFSLYQAQTGFQRKGIKGVELSEEDRNALIGQGIDPSDLDYSGTEIEVEVSNKDTLRKQWEEIMETCLKDQSGQLPGKTIVFAMTKAHAHRIAEVFEEMFPQHFGLVQVITSTTERVRDGSYGDGLISKFKKNSFPTIAISVDMLDTGIDVPEIVNLVFMKPVQSRIKLWQMIGRGTRNHEACKYFDRLPDGKKSEFKIIDFWQNDFNKQADDKVSVDVPVLVSVFNTRLKLLESQLPDHSTGVFKQAVVDIRAMLDRVPQDSFPVKKVWLQVSEAWTNDFWQLITPKKLDFLRLQVAPLLRFAANVDVAAETFTNKVERLKLQILTGTPSPQLLLSIAEDVSLLPDIAERVERGSIAKLALSANLASSSPEQLTELIRELAPEMKNRRNRPSAFLKIDLPDFIATRGYISVSEGGQHILIEEYKRRVDSRVLEIVEHHPAMEALRKGRELTDDELIDLERVLHRELGGGEIQLSSRTIRLRPSRANRIGSRGSKQGKVAKLLQHWADEKWWLQDNYVAAYAGKLSASEIDDCFSAVVRVFDAQWEARTGPHPAFQYLLATGLLPLQSIVSVGRNLRAVENCSNFKRVRDDLRNPRDNDSAVVELSVAAILAEAGYEITFRPELPNGKEADLLAKCGDEEVFFEIKIMHEAQSTEAVRAFTDGIMFTVGDFLRRRGGDELAFCIEVDSEIESMLGAGPTVDQDVVRGLLMSTLKTVEQNLTHDHYQFVIPHIGHFKFGSTTKIEKCGISSPGPHPGLELRRIMHRESRKQ